MAFGLSLLCVPCQQCSSLQAVTDTEKSSVTGEDRSKIEVLVEPAPFEHVDDQGWHMKSGAKGTQAQVHVIYYIIYYVILLGLELITPGVDTLCLIRLRQPLTLVS